MSRISCLWWCLLTAACAGPAGGTADDLLDLGAGDGTIHWGGSGQDGGNGMAELPEVRSEDVPYGVDVPPGSDVMAAPDESGWDGGGDVSLSGDSTVDADALPADAVFPDVGPIPCESHDDCLAAGPDLPDCLTLVCKDGWCKEALAAEGTPCLDPAEEPAECHHAACSLIGKCIVVPDENGTDCGKSDECVTWACQEGQCGQVYVMPCDDGNPCTDDGCYPGSGCVHKSNHEPCDDGDACTVGDQCAADACVPGEPAACSDGNPCTDDPCDAIAGCFHLVNKGTCQAGDKCAPIGECEKGECVNLVPVDCDDQNPCTQDSCLPDLGCVNLPVDGVPCDDLTACTVEDSCIKGQCHGKPLDCDDKNVCTDDACDQVKGCSHIPNTAVCEDGNLCSTGDVCKLGKCLPGTAAKCDDANPCTKDSCDSKTGCVHQPLSGGQCNDNNPCTLWDNCKDGVCAGFQIKKCDDGVACTSDSCDANGNCVYKPSDAACDDKNACTTDSCNVNSGCVHTPVLAGVCDDGNACTSGDVCVAGKCLGGAKDCTDGNLCTDDACDPLTGDCLHKAIGDGCDPTSVDGAVCPGGQYKFRVCEPGCVWSAWTQCQASSACNEIGSTQVCGGGPNCGYQKCSLINVWGPCNNGTWCDGGPNGTDACPGAKGCWDQGCGLGMCKTCTCVAGGTWGSCGKCLMVPQ